MGPRQKTFKYRQYLPYQTESYQDSLAHLDHIISNLYVSIKGDDLKGVLGNSTATALVHWTRELRSWLELKFEMPFDTRVRLVRLYFALSVAGADGNAIDKFVNMFLTLCKDDHFQNTVTPDQLNLDWDLLTTELKKLSFPHYSTYDGSITKAFSALSRLARLAREFIPPEKTASVLEAILPCFAISKASVSHNALTLLGTLIPCVPSGEHRDVNAPLPPLLPQQLWPTFFHLWSLQTRSAMYDYLALDLISSLVTDSIFSKYVPYSRYGPLTQEQLSVCFTAILRLWEVPVSYVGSPYVSSSETVSTKSEKDRRNRCARPIAFLLIYSLAGDESLQSGGVMDNIEGLIHAVETFCHPSNNGPWTRNILHTVELLLELFVLRWNMQISGESKVPKDRYLTENVKRRFVLALRNVTFMGIHSKSASVVSSSLEALQGLAYLAPDLILPRLLKEVYPSLRGLVETHRTISSLKALTILTRIIAKHPRYAIHLTTLLQLAIPGIDPNDLNKTVQSLAFIQAVASNVPFHDISDGLGPSLAMEYVQRDMEALEELPLSNDTVTGLPEIPADVLGDVLRSTTVAFEEFVVMFLGRVFNMLSNLPDPNSSKGRDVPETHVINSLPATMLALFGTVSKPLFNTIVKQVTDYVNSNVVHSASESIAHICGCLVKANADVAFPKLFPLLCANIRLEIEENGASSTRSTEILPRDHALIWNLSALNMILAHAGKKILEFKDDLVSITLFLREHSKGATVYHVSNTVHHALMSLSTTYLRDHSLLESEKATLEDWGKTIDPANLQLSWHVPSKEEVEFAVRLYSLHCNASSENLKKVMSGGTKTLSVTEVSDIVTSNLTYIRTATSGMAVLFDPHYEEVLSSRDGAATPMEIDIENEDSDSEGGTDLDDLIMAGLGGDSDEDDDSDDGIPFLDDYEDDDIDVGEATELKKLRVYPTGYFFENKSNNPLYLELHKVRRNLGVLLHNVNDFLQKDRESDISSFKALLFAFKVWISDVGLERSAKMTESMVALYKYDTQHYRIPGLRKDYPRPLLARRAHIYHLERLVHNSGPRDPSELERTMLHDIVKCALSIYPDIRRNGQSCLESSAKVLIRTRPMVYHWVLKEVAAALANKEYIKAESGLRVVNLRLIQASVKRDFKHIVTYSNLLKAAINADYSSLSSMATGLYGFFACSLRFLLGKVYINQQEVDQVLSSSATQVMSERIDKLKRKKAEKRSAALAQLQALLKNLLAGDKDAHWKVEASDSGVYTTVCTSPEVPPPPGIITKLSEGAQSMHPGIKMMSMHGLYKIVAQTFNLASNEYDYSRFLLSTNEERLPTPGTVRIQSNGKDFTSQYLLELNNVDHPSYYIDSSKYGWLVWPNEIDVNSTEYTESPQFSEGDRISMEALGGQLTEEWVKNIISRNSEEPRTEDDHFEMSNALLFRLLLRFIELGLANVTLDQFLAIVLDSYKPKDKNMHRCIAEICSAIVESLRFSSKESEEKKLKVVVSIFVRVIDEDMVNDNFGYWESFIWWTNVYTDHRRMWSLSKILNEFRVDPNSTTAVFRVSCRLNLLRKAISARGWQYRHVDEIVENLWDNINHPLQGVREEIAKTLAVIYKTSYFEGYGSTQEMVNAQENSPLGLPVYTISEKYRDHVVRAFERLEQWRLEREKMREQGLHKNSTSNYILAAKTLTTWLERVFKTSYAASLVPLLSKIILPALLQLLNVRDEQELMVSAVTLFKLLGNITFPLDTVSMMIDTIVDVCVKSTAWHQRLSILTFIQAFFFRQLFLMNKSERMRIVNAVVTMLEDVQLEVRLTAAETLAGLIRCSPEEEQAQLTSSLDAKFTETLNATHHLKNQPMRSVSVTPVSSRPGTPVEGGGSSSSSGGSHTLHIKRHAAVLGLGALVQAFPYKSPPPKWIPKVLATLAIKAASDPGMVGKSVKTTLSDFKKTRQDTWPIDATAFTTEQLEDLEGVLWKNYFV